MAKSIPRPLAPPTPELNDFTTSINNNLEEIYQIGHDHQPRSVAPAANEGSIGDMRPVVVSGGYKLYVKFSDGWKSVTLS